MQVLMRSRLRPGRLWVIGLVAMALLVAATGTPAEAQQAEFNVVLVDTSGRVVIQALGSKQQHQLAAVSDKVLKSPRWSPDGSQVALISEPGCPPNPVGVG